MIASRIFATAATLLLMLVAVACGDDGSKDPTTVSEGVQSTDAPDDASTEAPAVDDRFAVGEDGHRLAIRCWGEGSPAIVFEAGHPASSLADYDFSGDYRSLVCLLYTSDAADE